MSQESRADFNQSDWLKISCTQHCTDTGGFKGYNSELIAWPPRYAKGDYRWFTCWIMAGGEGT